MGAESESWLLREIQTPPVRTLLREYVVFFTDRRTKDGLVFPKPLITQVQKAVEARNRIVHRGDRPATDEETALTLQAANDVLYLLDWFALDEWAIGYVSKEVASAYA